MRTPRCSGSTRASARRAGLALCVNTAGQIVCHAGQRSAAPREIQVLMQPGRRLLEAELGTTAPGCVLEERRPVVVVRGEHYLHELEHLFCASAPIMAPDGQLAGALDITGCDVRALPLASDMVGFAVRRIENSMLAELANCAVLHFHRDERLLGTPFEALLGSRPRRHDPWRESHGFPTAVAAPGQRCRRRARLRVRGRTREPACGAAARSRVGRCRCRATMAPTRT